MGSGVCTWPFYNIKKDGGYSGGRSLHVALCGVCGCACVSACVLEFYRPSPGTRLCSTAALRKGGPEAQDLHAYAPDGERLLPHI